LAQDVLKIRRVGFLRVGQPPPAFIGNLRQGLRDLGLVEGQHFVFEFALAQSSAQMPSTASELVRRGIDLIVASGTPSVVPARDAAAQIPVVFIATVDPVATGLVASLAKPGRNITGLTSISGDLIAKRLQMITELLPGVAKIAVLVRDTSPTTTQYLVGSRGAAKNLGIELMILSEHNPNDLGAIFVAAQGSRALVVSDDAEFTAHRDQIAEMALRNHLPTVFGFREMVQAGGLMAYGANFGDLYRRAASHVQKILQGANPGDLPVEQPTKFDLIINLKTAKALGLEIPATLLARADEVIE
jgi:putative ABC transport system substrate-binding protein